MGKKFSILIMLVIQASFLSAQDFYKGTTMGFAMHLEENGNIVYKEDGVAKDPFQSIADHGGNMVRFRIDLPPYSNSYSAGYPDPDFRSPQNVKLGMQRAKDAGLKTLLTFGLKSFALGAEQKLNDYVAPLAWQPIAGDLEKLKDSVYSHTYSVLDDYINSELIPEIVSIGNETNWRILEQNIAESELDSYSAQRTVDLLNSGTRAVRDINTKYDLNIQIAIHIFGASHLKWWMNEHASLGLDFDIMALSHYHQWHSMGAFNNWGEVIDWVKNNYQKDFMILETAQLFTDGWNDNHANILGTGNIPSGYPNPPTTETQRKYLGDFAREINDAGGIGLIVWGGEWVATDNCLIYADQWGAGSSWENKTFWDFDNNLHDGINWMKDVSTSIQLIQEFDIHMYPNPTDLDYINISGSKLIKDIQLISITGKLIYRKKLKENPGTLITLDLSSCAEGLYILKIVDKNHNAQIKKLVKR